MEKETNIYDLSQYRTKKILSKNYNYEKFQVLGTSHTKHEKYEVLLNEILNNKATLFITERSEDLVVKELLNHISEKNILNDSVKLYKLLYNSKLFILNTNHITKIWLESKKLVSHRGIDYIMIENYNAFRDYYVDFESISSELNVKIIAFV